MNFSFILLILISLTVVEAAPQTRFASKTRTAQNNAKVMKMLKSFVNNARYNNNKTFRWSPLF